MNKQFLYNESISFAIINTKEIWDRSQWLEHNFSEITLIDDKSYWINAEIWQWTRFLMELKVLLNPYAVKHKQNTVNKWSFRWINTVLIETPSPVAVDCERNGEKRIVYVDECVCLCWNALIHSHRNATSLTAHQVPMQLHVKCSPHRRLTRVCSKAEFDYILEHCRVERAHRNHVN